MPRFFKNIFNALLITLVSSGAYAQVKFSATITPRINKDQYATLRLLVENADDVQQISPPNIKGLEIVSGPNQESGMSSVNGGQVKQYIAMSYILKPRFAGQFTIPPSSAIVNGKKMMSNAVSVTVADASSGQAQSPATVAPSPFSMFDDVEPQREREVDMQDWILHSNETIQAKVDKNMMLRAETNKTSVYVGEPLIASYKFYTRLKSESKLSKNPSFNGFSVIDLMEPDAGQSTVQKVNGRAYTVYNIRKAQLYPLQAGDIQLETATMDNSLQFIKESAIREATNSRDIFGDLSLPPDATITQQVSLTSKPLTITVKPLPETGKPTNFSGAVGNFTVEAALSQTSFSTDATGILTVKISGAGNLQLITAPSIQWPAGIEAFDPKLTDELDKTQVPVRGTKTFVYNFSVTKPGNYQLLPVSFSFFDPSTATYHSPEATTQAFVVSQGRNNTRLVSADRLQQYDDQNVTGFLSRYKWWLIGGLAALLAIISLFRSKKTKVIEKGNDENISRPLVPEVEEAEVLTGAEIRHTEALTAEQLQVSSLINPLEESEICLLKEDCATFFTILNKELRAFLSGKLAIAPQDLDSNSIAEALDKRGLNHHSVLALEKLMKEIEWQLYTPFQESEGRQEFYSKAVQLVQEIK